MTDRSLQLPGRSSAAGGAATTAASVAAWAVGGAMAALALAYLPLPVRMPGHVILKGALPIAVALAAAPGAWAGSAAGLAALATSLGLGALGVAATPLAAAASIIALGPAADLAAMGAAMRRRPLVRFALAGMAANLAALAVRYATGAIDPSGLASHPMRSAGWLAPVSFALCGLAAGLLVGSMRTRRAAQTQGDA